jgi:hypothetical protein
METGSELMLGDDGQFQWYFSYGALDLLAKGRWHREGDRVVLVPDDFRSPPDYSQLAFKRMQLRVDGKDLVPAWPWGRRRRARPLRRRIDNERQACSVPPII